MPDVFSPGRIGPLTLRNRVIKAATYEGLSHRSRVTTDLVEFHRAYAAGGVGMTTVAYCAVAPDGRTAPDQILWTDEAMPGLRVLTDAVHAEGAAVSAQIGHAGPVADPRGNQLPALSPSTRFPNMSGGVSRKAKRADLERITAAHAAAATRAIEAGFDAVEVHLGHSYLPSAFLSPKINHRKDEFGGSLENRARFARGHPARRPRRGRRPDRDPHQAEHVRRRPRRHHRRRGDPDRAVDRGRTAPSTPSR